MVGGDLSAARLCNAGLGDVDWPGVCLRGSDLRQATFHMGSSRSGLVDSTIASEGSRTGFYTDDYSEQDFKSPEEIRKANLCRADLRGALIDGVDFYLVDLRGRSLRRRTASPLPQMRSHPRGPLRILMMRHGGGHFSVASEIGGYARLSCQETPKRSLTQVN